VYKLLILLHFGHRWDPEFAKNKVKKEAEDKAANAKKGAEGELQAVKDQA
jgi:hypothetical protein